MRAQAAFPDRRDCFCGSLLFVRLLSGTLISKRKLIPRKIQGAPSDQKAPPPGIGENAGPGPSAAAFRATGRSAALNLVGKGFGERR